MNLFSSMSKQLRRTIVLDVFFFFFNKFFLAACMFYTCTRHNFHEVFFILLWTLFSHAVHGKTPRTYRCAASPMAYNIILFTEFFLQLLPGYMKGEVFHCRVDDLNMDGRFFQYIYKVINRTLRIFSATFGRISSLVYLTIFPENRILILLSFFSIFR